MLRERADDGRRGGRRWGTTPAESLSGPDWARRPTQASPDARPTPATHPPTRALAPACKPPLADAAGDSHLVADGDIPQRMNDRPPAMSGGNEPDGSCLEQPSSLSPSGPPKDERMDSEDTAKMTAGPEGANVESQERSVIGQTITEEDAVGSVAPEMIKADGETQNREEMPLPPSPLNEPFGKVAEARANDRPQVAVPKEDRCPQDGQPGTDETTNISNAKSIATVQGAKKNMTWKKKGHAHPAGKIAPNRHGAADAKSRHTVIEPARRKTGSNTNSFAATLQAPPARLKL